MNGRRRVLIVTNNPDIEPAKGRLLFVPGGPLQVFREARELIFRGYVLVSHPLMGSLKPWQNPYRSVVLLEPPGSPAALDSRSIVIIDKAMAILQAREKEVGSRPNYDRETLCHLRHLDCELVGQTGVVKVGDSQADGEFEYRKVDSEGFIPGLSEKD